MKYPRHISKILPDVVKDLDIEKKIKNWQLIEKWSAIVGKQIAAHSHAYACDDKTLWVEVDDPLWQSQLFLLKNQIIKKIERLKFNIQDIKFRIVRKLHKKENG